MNNYDDSHDCENDDEGVFDCELANLEALATLNETLRIAAEFPLDDWWIARTFRRLPFDHANALYEDFDTVYLVAEQLFPEWGAADLKAFVEHVLKCADECWDQVHADLHRRWDEGEEIGLADLFPAVLV